MAKDRSRDDRRTVGSHEKMMGALGRAAHSNITPNSIEGLASWVKPQSVRSPNSAESNADRDYKKGKITSDERAFERVDAAVNDNYRFHKGMD